VQSKSDTPGWWWDRGPVRSQIGLGASRSQARYSLTLWRVRS